MGEVIMNIQIFGTKKSADTRKAERFFKERGVRFQSVDLKEKGLSKLKVHFTQEELDKSRWGVYGQKLHFDNIAKGHKRAAEGTKQIKNIFHDDYRENIKSMRVELPSIGI